MTTVPATVVERDELPVLFVPAADELDAIRAAWDELERRRWAKGAGKRLADASDVELGQVLQRSAIRPLPCERANVHLINHLPLLRHASPFRVGPFERCGIDDLRRPMRSVRLEARGGIRERAGVQFVLIQHARLGVVHEPRKITIPFGFKQLDPSFEFHRDGL